MTSSPVPDRLRRSNHRLWLAVLAVAAAAAGAVTGAATPDQASMCVWFDNDRFGEIVSPTMNAATLATVMRTVRPDLEIVVP